MNDVLTPVESCSCAGGVVWLKRDDLAAEWAGVRGSKARAVWEIAQGATGIVTAGTRDSTISEMAAAVCAHLGIPCEVHVVATPKQRRETVSLAAVRQYGGLVIEHAVGGRRGALERFARAAMRDEAKKREGWRYLPYALECAEYVQSVRSHVRNLPFRDGGFRRLVVPVGCGMTLSGILWGLRDVGADHLPVLGVLASEAAAERRLDRYAPKGWRDQTRLVPARVRELPNHSRPVATQTQRWWDGVLRLDAGYEAKAAAFVVPGDCLWVVGLHTWQQS